MKRPTIIKLLVAVGALAVAAVAWQPLVAWFTGERMRDGGSSKTTRQQAGSLAIDGALHPDPPEEKDNTLALHVRDATGKPVDGATVTVTYVMPAMGSMPEMRGTAEVEPKADGRYDARFDLPMGGSWTLQVRVAARAGSGSARFSMTVGTSGLNALGGSGTTADGHAGSDAAYYTCSMHPSVRQQQPGNCPICSMTLSPVTYDEQETGVIMVDEHRREQVGIRTGTVVRAPMTRSIRAVGRIAYDESKLEDVTLKLGGFISKLYVNETGQRVKKGERLFTIYSPDLFAAQQEYLLARDSNATSGGGRGDYLVRAAEKKLELWGLSRGQIDALARRGKPLEDVPFYSPVTGYVIEKNVVEGAAVEVGQRLLRIAALDRVWVEADVYEADLALIAKGMKALVTLSYLPGKRYEGKVAYVYPYLDRASRTGKVRIELPNQGLELKPEMYATVAFQVELGPRLQIPIDAVVYTGPRRLVFVDIGEGRLQPQEVTLGVRNEDTVEVIRGLQEGEKIVTAGNFLVAAESRIRSNAKFWTEERVGEATGGDR